MLRIPSLVLAALVAAPVVAGTPAENLLKKSDDWFRSEAGREAIDNILSWQTARGDWPKNMDTTATAFSGKGEKPAGTFDNGATVGELRALAKAFRVTGDERCRTAFVRGFDHILEAQYPNGGWPQYYPPGDGYHRHITFNDNAMIRLLELLRDVAEKDEYAFLDAPRREAARQAVERGIDCILKCQVIVEGTPTVWCAQHHAETLEPVPARSFEPASLSGAESAWILEFLMRLDTPSPEVVRAVKAGVAWFDAVKIEGYRYTGKGTGPALVPDPDAPTLWARFYEIGTNRPIFSDRDSVVRYHLEEVGPERRTGYAWYGTWGAKVLEMYAEWPHH
ncbi:pectate lyase [Thermostilla marina]